MFSQKAAFEALDNIPKPFSLKKNMLMTSGVYLKNKDNVDHVNSKSLFSSN